MEQATAFNAIPEKMRTVPWTPKYRIRIVIKWGAIMGPSPVIVHDMPVAILRFSLKYVFRASELDEVVIPIPDPKTEEYNFSRVVINQWRAVNRRVAYRKGWRR